MLQAAISSVYQPLPARSINRPPQTLGRSFPSGREEITRAPTTDLGLLYPEAVVKSSDAIGWQDIRVVHLRHNLSELELPASDNHCVVLNLGSPFQVNVQLAKRRFEGAVRTGEVAIIPAGSSWVCQSEGSRCQTLLLLDLRP